MPNKTEKVDIVDGQVYVRASVAAMMLGVTSRTLNDWVKRGCPRCEDRQGYYCMKDVIQWRYASDNTPQSLESQKQKADIKYREARALREELQLKAALGEYVAVEDISVRLKDVFSRIRMNLLTLEQKIVSSLYATYPECAFEVAELVQKEVERGLGQLSNGEDIDGSNQKRKPKRGRNTK